MRLRLAGVKPNSEAIRIMISACSDLNLAKRTGGACGSENPKIGLAPSGKSVI
jgi:hypothetical protein